MTKSETIGISRLAERSRRSCSRTCHCTQDPLSPLLFFILQRPAWPHRTLLPAISFPRCTSATRQALHRTRHRVLRVGGVAGAADISAARRGDAVDQERCFCRGGGHRRCKRRPVAVAQHAMLHCCLMMLRPYVRDVARGVRRCAMLRAEAATCSVSVCVSCAEGEATTDALGCCDRQRRELQPAMMRATSNTAMLQP